MIPIQRSRRHQFLQQLLCQQRTEQRLPQRQQQRRPSSYCTDGTTTAGPAPGSLTSTNGDTPAYRGCATTTAVHHAHAAWVGCMGSTVKTRGGAPLIFGDGCGYGTGMGNTRMYRNTWVWVLRIPVSRKSHGCRCGCWAESVGVGVGVKFQHAHGCRSRGMGV